MRQGPVEVVGVVADVRAASLNQAPSNTVYVPYWQASNYKLSVAVKSGLPPKTAAAVLRHAIRQLDSELPVEAVQTMDERLAGSVAPRRFQMTLVLVFAAAALLLASLGIYGVVSYTVGQRTAEMGIRMALGAQPRGIMGLVLRQGMAPVAAGLAFGIAGAVAAQRVMASLLFNMSAADPWTIAAVLALLTAVAALAGYVPARRATRIDPAAALREQ